MTLSDLEWPFHSWRAISAVAERLVFVTSFSCVGFCKTNWSTSHNQPDERLQIFDSFLIVVISSWINAFKFLF